jgi:hypothetical protein
MRCRKFHPGYGHVIRIAAFIVLGLTLLPLKIAADTIVLKSGRTVEVDMAWIEDGQVKGVLSGAVVTYPQSAVERVDRPRNEKASVADDGGFQFGVWASGMSVENARQLAGEHTLELLPGRLPASEGALVTLPGKEAAGRGTALHYRELLLEKAAEIEMQFTPVSERLYGLTVRWTGSDLGAESEFFKTVYSNLAQKYGRPDQKESKLLSIAYRWKIEKRCWVDLESGDNAIEIRYVDTKFEKSAEAEHQSQGRAVDSADARP